MSFIETETHNGFRPGGCMRVVAADAVGVVAERGQASRGRHDDLDRRECHTRGQTTALWNACDRPQALTPAVDQALAPPN
jgi:hypothetical protein